MGKIRAKTTACRLTRITAVQKYSVLIFDLSFVFLAKPLIFDIGG